MIAYSAGQTYADAMKKEEGDGRPNYRSSFYNDDKGNCVDCPHHDHDMIYQTRILEALQAPTSIWRPFEPLDFVLGRQAV